MTWTGLGGEGLHGGQSHGRWAFRDVGTLEIKVLFRDLGTDSAPPLHGPHDDVS